MMVFSASRHCRRIGLACFVVLALILAPAAMPSVLQGQFPLASYADAMEMHVSRAQADMQYTLHVDPSDSLGISMEIALRNAPDTIRLTMPVWGPGSYRYGGFYRYVRGVSATVAGRPLVVRHADSTHWSAVVGTHADTAHGAGDSVVIRYRIQWPSVTAATGLNNYSFVRRDGALVHGPTTYMYLEGQTLAPVRVRIEAPPDWAISTGLTPGLQRREFFAPSYDILIDSPILLGQLHRWYFSVDGVSHEVAYYATHPIAFDTAAFVGYHQRVVEAARNAFGRLPYREYHFLYEDGPGGGLEHLNSTTLGAPSERLARNPLAFAGLTAHEYAHAWNVKRARPIALGPFAYQIPPRVSELYWAEGVTDFFSDEFLRHSRIRSERDALVALQGRIATYLSNPGRDKISPEASSRHGEWDGGIVSGGYDVSYYLDGSLIGEQLEFMLRDRTNGQRGIDAVERRLLDNFAGKRGYTREDLIDAVNAECRCDLRAFFDEYVSRATPFELNRQLALAGWRLDTVRVEARDPQGRPIPDVRARISRFGGIGSLAGVAGGPARLQLESPEVAFARAGLRTGDHIISVNGRAIMDDATLQSAFAGVRTGDTVHVEYKRASGAGKEQKQEQTVKTAVATASGYDILQVAIRDLSTITERQRMVRRAWYGGGSQ